MVEGERIPSHNSELRLPSFFVIGPPRTGSSWLYQILKTQAILPNPSKETRFFDTHYHRGLKWYQAHFKPSNGLRCIGEVAPTYFASSAARERMAQIVPNARIICVFRNPVDRIVSLYRLKRAYGLIPWDFEKAIERDPELLESGRYASTLKLWQNCFGESRVMAGIYDDLKENPQEFVDRLLDFIGLPRFLLRDGEKRLVHDSENMTHPRSYYRTKSALFLADWLKARRLDTVVTAFKQSSLRRFVLGGGSPFTVLPEEVLAGLFEKCQPEVEALEAMMNRDLSNWKLQTRA